MSDRSAFSKSIVSSVIVALLVIGVPAVLHITLGIPRFWTVIGALVAVVYTSVVLPPYIVSRLVMRRSPSHERIRATRTWQSPKPPQIVLDEIGAALRGRGAVSRLDDQALEITCGSDEGFRRWGVFSERGRQQLPSRMTIQVLADGSGSRVTADARDDLGWFLGPLGSRVKQEAMKAVESLLDELDSLAEMERRA